MSSLDSFSALCWLTWWVQSCLPVMDNLINYFTQTVCILYDILQHVRLLINRHVFKHVGWLCCWCSLEQGIRICAPAAAAAPAGRAVPAGQLQCRRWRWSMNTVQSEDVSPQATEPPLDQSGIHATPSTLHPSLQQPHWTTLIYSSKPKISRCFHSDILHVIKSGVGEHFLLKHAAHPAPQQAFVPLLIRIRQLRVTGCEAVGPSLACQSRGVCAVSRGALEPYCASSPSLPFFYFSPPRKHGNSRRGQPVR